MPEAESAAQATTPAEFAVVATEGSFDGERYCAGPLTLHLDGGRIREVSTGDYGGAFEGRGVRVVRGAFVMPGFVDAHVHLLLHGVPVDGPSRAAHAKQPVEALLEAARASARQSLRYGVCHVRDAGDRYAINDMIRDEVAGGATGMTKVYSAGIGLKRPKQYGAFIGLDVTDRASIIAAVTERNVRADAIKIVLTGLIDFERGAVTDEPQFATEEAALIVNAAHRCGKPTLAHCSGLKGLEVAAEARVASIEHGFFMSRAMLALMCERRIAWTPTFCPVHFQWACPQACGWSQAAVSNLRRILDAHREHLRLAHEMGVELLLGTDAGSMGVEHGKAVTQEIRHYVEAGLPLEAALKAATTTNRRHLGLPDARIAPCNRFEALLFEESPFAKLSALESPCRIWSG